MNRVKRRARLLTSTIRITLFAFVAASSVAWTSFAPGAEQAEPGWLSAARERIEQHRQAEATITVVDGDGRPVADAELVVEQTRHAFLFGCNIFAFNRLRAEPDNRAYRQRFEDLFNFATLPFYWPSYEPRSGQPRHDETQQVAQWCRARGIRTKGHPLAWNYADPGWLPEDVDEIRRLQLARIGDCVSRFRGLIDTWDVVNEATHFERAQMWKRAPKMTRMWEETGRLELVAQCFRAARRANESATLLINDYRTDAAYADLLHQLTDKMGARPFDVIGIQSHMHNGVWSNERIWEVCERFQKFGVPLHFTELTVLSGEQGWQRARQHGSWPSTPDGETRQARDVVRIYTMLFSHPAVAAITWWDLSDRNAWQQAPAGLLGRDFSPKPAYEQLHDLVKRQWWTSARLRTDAEGRVTFRGFLGDYRLRVRTMDGRQRDVAMTLTKRAANGLRIVLEDGS